MTIGGALCLAYVFARLARAMPHAAGPTIYVRTAFGAPAAFFVMWSYWISVMVTNATLSVAAVSYSRSLARRCRPARRGAVAAVGFDLAVQRIACRGARTAGGVQR